MTTTTPYRFVADAGFSLARCSPSIPLFPKARYVTAFLVVVVVSLSLSILSPSLSLFLALSFSISICPRRYCLSPFYLVLSLPRYTRLRHQSSLVTYLSSLFFSPPSWPRFHSSYGNLHACSSGSVYLEKHRVRGARPLYLFHIFYLSLSLSAGFPRTMNAWRPVAGRRIM